MRARIRRKLKAVKQEAIQLPHLNCLCRRESVLSTYGFSTFQLNFPKGARGRRLLLADKARFSNQRPSASKAGVTSQQKDAGGKREQDMRERSKSHMHITSHIRIGIAQPNTFRRRFERLGHKCCYAIVWPFIKALQNARKHSGFNWRPFRSLTYSFQSSRGPRFPTLLCHRQPIELLVGEMQHWPRHRQCAA